MTTYKNGLHKILNDDSFWQRYIKVSTQTHERTMRNAKHSGYIPKRDAFDTFIENYIIIAKDNRPEKHIRAEMVSEITE